jgi:hypothetical protein
MHTKYTKFAGTFLNKLKSHKLYLEIYLKDGNDDEEESPVIKLRL